MAWPLAIGDRVTPGPKVVETREGLIRRRGSTDDAARRREGWQRPSRSTAARPHVGSESSGSARVGEDHEAVQQAEGDRGHDEEVAGDGTLKMIPEEGAPRLG